MTKLFLTILGMSYTASYCILIVCAARLLLKKAPKVFSYLLWSVVAFRLLCPCSFESNFSLMGIRGLVSFVENGQSMLPADTLAPNILAAEDGQSGIPTQGSAGDGNMPSVYIDGDFGAKQQFDDNTALSDKKTASPFGKQLSGSSGISAALLSILVNIGAYVWIAGVGILLVYCIFTYLHLKQKLRIRAKDSGFFKGISTMTVAGLDTPFVLGFFKPVIYLPERLAEEESRQCLAHEYTHIRRKDHFIKQFAFLLCCIYWFHPLVWIAFYLMTKDMEMSCDELALRSNSLEDRKAYSETLLNLSSKPGHFAGCPLAFGENSIKTRIKNIMNYKRPGFWVILFSVLLVLFFLLGLIANPVSVNLPSLPVMATNLPAAAGISLKPDETAAPAAGNTDAQETVDSLKKQLEQEKAQRNALLLELAQNTSADAAQTMTEQLEKHNYQIENMTLALQDLLIRQILNGGTPEEIFVLSAVISTESGKNAAVTLNVPPEDPYKTVELQNGTYVEILAYDGEDAVLIRFKMGEDDVSSILSGTVSASQLNIALPENTDLTLSYWIGKLWGNAFCSRDKLTLQQMAADKKAFDASESFGWSSPWPWSFYQVEVPGRDAKRALTGDISLTYYAETSDPTVTVWKQTLHLPDGKSLSAITSLSALAEASVRPSEVTYYENISTYEDFMNAYSGGSLDTAPTIFDFEKNYGEALKQEAYTEPITAVENYLHLENGRGEVIETGIPGEIFVRYTFFSDGCSANIPMHALSGNEEYWCIDYERLMSSDYFRMMFALELNPEHYTDVLKKWTDYLNQPENNAFITTNFYGAHIDLDMLLYDSASFLENAPVGAEEQKIMEPEERGGEVRCHYTGEQLDDFLKGKMNVTLTDIFSYEDSRNELMSDWFYLEDYDTYTVFGIKGDTIKQEIVCTDITLNNDGSLCLYYSALPDEAGASGLWIEKGALTVQPHSFESDFSRPDEYYFMENTIMEGWGMSH